MLWVAVFLSLEGLNSLGQADIDSCGKLKELRMPDLNFYRWKIPTHSKQNVFGMK